MLPAIVYLLVLLQGGISYHVRRGNDQRLQYEKSLTKSSMSKILGGSTAEYGEYPFIVSLELSGYHICGGSVISKNWLMTASHCVAEEYLRNGLVIRAGSMNKEEGGTVHEIEKIIVHPAFNVDPMFDSDVALIKVKELFTNDKYVKSVRLGKKTDIPKEGEDVVAAGWGLTSSIGDGDTSTDLLDVTLRAIDSNECDSTEGMNRIRRMVPDNVQISDNMLCAVAEGKDTCKGDSGGPLLKYKEDGKEPLLVGVVSWGEGNGRLDSPGVYSNVANFIKWTYLETVTLP